MHGSPPRRIRIFFSVRQIADRWREAAKLIGIDIVTMPDSEAYVMSGTFLGLTLAPKASAWRWDNASPRPHDHYRR